MCLENITIQLLSIDIMQFNLFDHSKNKNGSKYLYTRIIALYLQLNEP